MVLNRITNGFNWNLTQKKIAKIVYIVQKTESIELPFSHQATLFFSALIKEQK